LWGVKSAAELLGVSAKTVTRACTRLGIHPARIGKKEMLFYTKPQIDAIRKALKRAA
jgi:hypothetical protein